MHLRSHISVAIFIAVLTAPAFAQAPAEQQLRATADARIKAGTADPAADATAAASRGEFGLIVTGDGARGGRNPAGVICFTPGYNEPRLLFGYSHSDYITQDVGRWLEYAAAYNRTIVDHAAYPDSDLCRTSASSDASPRARWPVNTPARAVTGPPRSLDEAARRGDAADLRRFLASTGKDSPDSMGMTPIAWAVARNNKSAIDVLVAAGADPWAGEWDTGAIFLAAAFGREDAFTRLSKLPGRKWKSWPAVYLNAALDGGSRQIIKHMLAEPHEKYRLDMQPRPLPSADLLELVLSDIAPTQLLRDAISRIGQPSRVDLVKYALERGANPNGIPREYETPLAIVAKGIDPDSLEIIDLLLKAGADPDGMSHRDRPIWQSIRILTLDGKISDIDRRATAAMDRLIAAGADINLPNDQGVQIFFPRYHDRTEYDPSFVTPDLLDVLVSRGLDLNATWQGRSVLGPVEEKGGADSELATALRRFGARK